MGEVPLFVLVLLVPGVVAFGVLGLRGLLDILDALRHAELTRLAAPLHWPVTRAFFGACTAVPIYLATASQGTVHFKRRIFCGGANECDYSFFLSTQ